MQQYEDFLEENVFWLPVQTDHGIEMTKYHSNYQVAGDTDSCYMRLPACMQDISIEDSVDICDDIAAITNESFNDFCKAAFNMPKSREGSIAADREAVSDKALFLSKKRYIMHLVNMEGKPVDKLKIMGVEIIKSDTSQITKKMLMEVVNMILDDSTMEDVTDRIKAMKDEFYSASIRDLASPSGCKTLLKTVKLIEETGSAKGAHFSARAAIFYNSLCDIKDQPIRAGDKIGIVYIKDHRSKYIAYPLDAQMLPEWLDDIIIDYDTLWQKANTKITNYIESMGWTLRQRKAALVKSMFGLDTKTKKKGKK